jgi:hypothetical protein
MMNNAYAKYYNPSEHLAIDEVIVLFKGREHSKKHKHFGIKVFKLYDSTGYIYNMKIYLGKE